MNLSTIIPRRFWFVLFFASLVLIQACGESGETVAGGEDFPNALADVGDTLDGHFKSLNDWDVLARASAESDSLANWRPAESEEVVLSGALLRPSAVLHKQMLASEDQPIIQIAATEDSQWGLDYSDTANGVFRVFSTTEGLVKTNQDTLVVRWDEFARDTIEDNESLMAIRSCEYFENGTRYCYQIEDLDGDSLIVAQGGGCNEMVSSQLCNTVKASSQWYNQQGVMLVEGYWEAASGADADFDLEDDNALRVMNRIRFSTAGDTTMMESWEVAHNEQWVITGGDSVVVDYSKWERALAEGMRETRFRALYFPKDTNATRFIDFSEEQVNALGVQVLTTLTFPGARDSLDAANVGDTIVIHTLWRGAAGVWVRDLWLDVILDGAASEDDHFLIGAKAEVRNLQTRYYRSFHFIPGRPLKDGEEPESGQIELIETDALGKDLRVTGVWDLDFWEVEITDRESQTWDVVFSTDGELISAE